MRKILVVGAHPADPIDLAGGTLYRHAFNTNNVKCISLTYGNRGHGSDVFFVLPEEQQITIKKEEFTKACDIIGADSCILGFKDEPYIYNELQLQSMVAIIRDFKPDIIITHHPNEFAHWDHAECGKMMCRAIKASVKLKGDKYYVPMVYFFGVAFRPESARVGVVPQAPDLLIDISGRGVENKVKAMCCFESQGHDSEEAMWKRMDSFESEMGRADGLRYSEGFIFYQPIKRHLLLFNDDKGFYTGKENIE